MPDFKVARIKYRWRGSWTAGEGYILDDMVSFGGKTYVCIVQHTSAESFYTDFEYLNNDIPPAPEPRWILMTDGYRWTGDWQTSREYALGDIARYGGINYICIQRHNSSALQNLFTVNDLANWIVYVSAENWTGNWQVATYYKKNELVKYGGILYRCTVSHLSANLIVDGLEADQSKWEIVILAEDWKGNWNTNTRYKVNDIVKYGGIVYRCNDEHLSANSITDGLEVDSGKWITVNDGFEFKTDWAASTRYKLNDIVKYGGNTWRCISPHTSSGTFDTTAFTILFPGFEFDGVWDLATVYQQGDVVRYGGYLYVAKLNNVNSPPSLNPLDWELLSLGIRIREEWISTASYIVGDLVRRSAQVYVCIANNINQDPDIIGDGTTLNNPYWELVIPGDMWKGDWSSGTRYNIGDLVGLDSSTWRCIQAHVAVVGNRPNNDNEGYYWIILTPGATSNRLRSRGDIKTYDVTEDGSSIGPTRRAIGADGEVLKVVDGVPIWQKLNETSKVYYVSLDGIDDPAYGTTLQAPWRTIRYACENITGVATVFIKHGVYQEVLPIKVPAFVALVGDELRGTIVEPAPTLIAAGDNEKTRETLSYLASIIDDVFSCTPVSPKFSTATQDISLTPATGQEATEFQTKVSIINSILIGTATPGLTGTASITINANRLSAADLLLENRTFLIQEGLGFLAATYPNYTFDTTACGRDLGRFIDAIRFEFLYSGNWKSVEAALYYKSASDGAYNARNDMFLLRDGTGLRNMTVRGLTGTLGNLNSYNTRRPTAGAYAALDPGYGPDDQSVWVGTKSPYVQNVSTFGTACIGLKVDGDIHNGGNQTIVANDFTQILSDGIGAWIRGTGRAELVSVFTYYCHIGYLAENGGRIRATNGNCSYGTYGVVSEGVNPTESPITAKVNNRYYDATVGQTFAINGKVGKILFDNAGQNYTSATYTILGSGGGVQTEQTEFRSGGIFQARLYDPGDSGAIGGGGWVFNANNSQSGTAYSIRLAGSDENDASVYETMRLFIASGTGAGQYGMIARYNDTTKDAYITPENIPSKTATSTTASTDRVFINSTTHLKINDPILFVGTSFGGILDDTVYYVLSVDSANEFTMSLNPGGSIAVLTDDTGSMTMYHLGWNHINPGTALASLLDTTTLYNIEPRLVFSEPATGSSLEAISASRKWSDVAFGNNTFVAVALGSSNAATSTSGSTWTTRNMPSPSTDWTSVAYGAGKFVAVSSSGRVAYSQNNGSTWIEGTIAASGKWSKIRYANGTFVIVGLQGAVAATSPDGTTWTTRVLPDGGDWNTLAYGNGTWLTIASSDSGSTQSAYSTDNGASWTNDSSALDYGVASLAFGNGRFVALGGNSNQSYYSFDGLEWETSFLPTSGNWTSIAYGQGCFFAVQTGSTNAARSYDGVTWYSELLANTGTWSAITHGTPGGNFRFVAVAGDSSTASTDVMLITSGSRAQGRVTIASGRLTNVLLWEPGAGYTTTPTLTLVDPNNTSEATIILRTAAEGILANPSFIARGSGYRTTTTTTTIVGDGFKDEFQRGKFLVCTEMTRIPSPGDNLNILSITDYTYKILNAEYLAGTSGNYTIRLTVGKQLGANEAPDHEQLIEIRQQYSQARMSGHDFLDIGLGNFEQTNYPNVLFPVGTVLSPQNEVVESGGGRVFYTSTDQDGNFRAGELFAVEQATGIVTLSADFFQLEGLEELRLGGVAVGGSGVVIREFSTDATFTADSNNIIPTQRAIKAYIQSRVSGGGSNAVTGIATAGTVRVGIQEFNTTTGFVIEVPEKVRFLGGIDGDMLTMSYFCNSFSNDDSGLENI